MKSKCFVLILGILILGSIVFAAGQGEGGAAAEGATGIIDADNVTPAGTFPVVREPVTLTTAFRKHPKIEDLETNLFTLMIEEKTGVEFDFQVLPWGGETQQKVMLMFASNDLPELFMGAALPDAAILDYGSQGLIRPLNDLIDAYGVETKAMWAEAKDDPNLINTMKAADGNYYYLPKYSEQTVNTYNWRCYVYTPWMETLGLEYPETTDEYYEMLKTFKTEDPNGNGKADEIPYLGHTGGLMPSFFINAWIHDDNGDRFIVRDGKVDVSYRHPEFKEALQWLNMLVKEGLLDPLTFTQDQNSMKSIMNQEEVLIGSFAQSTKTGVLDRNIPFSNQRSKEYYPIAPLKGPHGVQLTHPTPTVPQPLFYLTSECKNPGAAFRVGDYILSPEVTLIGRWGFEGTNWRKPEQGVLGYDGTPAIFDTFNDVWGMKTHNVHWQYVNPGFHPREIIDRTATPDDPLDYLYVQWKASVVMADYVPDEVVPRKLTMTLDEMDQWATLQPSIRTYLTENIAKFIIGDRSFDEWDNFLAEFDKMDLNEFISLVQTAYDRTVGK